MISRPTKSVFNCEDCKTFKVLHFLLKEDGIWYGEDICLDCGQYVLGPENGLTSEELEAYHFHYKHLI